MFLFLQARFLGQKVYLLIFRNSFFFNVAIHCYIQFHYQNMRRPFSTTLPILDFFFFYVCQLRMKIASLVSFAFPSPCEFPFLWIAHFYHLLDSLKLGILTLWLRYVLQIYLFQREGKVGRAFFFFFSFQSISQIKVNGVEYLLFFLFFF